MSDKNIAVAIVPKEGFLPLGVFLAKAGYGRFDEAQFVRQFAHQSYHAIAIMAGDGAYQGACLYRVAGDEAEIIEIAVAPSCQGQGLGAQMMAQLIAIVAGQGVVRLVLEVAEGNLPAIALYQKCGFVAAGKRIAYYEGKIDAVIMELWLSKKGINATL